MLRIIRARPLRGAAANAGCEVVAPLADALRMPPLLRSTTSGLALTARIDTSAPPSVMRTAAATSLALGPPTITTSG